MTMTRGEPGGEAPAPALKRGLFKPMLWNRLHAPWNRWMPRAMLATM